MGLYCGATNNDCNLKYQIPYHIPIAFYNFSGYDAHLFIKELGKKFNKDDIKVIAEKYADRNTINTEFELFFQNFLNDISNIPEETLTNIKT